MKDLFYLDIADAVNKTTEKSQNESEPVALAANIGQATWPRCRLYATINHDPPRGYVEIDPDIVAQQCELSERLAFARRPCGPGIVMLDLTYAVWRTHNAYGQPVWWLRGRRYAHPLEPAQLKKKEK